MSETTPAALTGAEARRAARNAGAIAAARIVSSGALFGWQLVLAPWLGAKDYGIYGTVGSLLAVAASLASFGMGMIVIRDVARQPAQAGRYLSVTLYAQTLLALLAYLGVNGAALALGYDETIRAFAALAGISLFVDLFGNMCFDQLLAHEQMGTTSLVEVVHVLARIGLALAALFGGLGLLGVYAATLISGLGRSAALWWALRRRGIRPHFPLDRPLSRALLVNSAPLALSAMLALAYQHADKLITTMLIGATGTGYLTAAFVIVYGVVEILSTTVLIATYPLMSRAYAGSGQDGVFGFIVQKLAFFTLLVALPMSLTFTFFAADITTPLFGADFAPTAEVLRVLMWYTAATMVANVFAQAMMVQNRQRRLLTIRASGLAVNILLNVLLLPRLGVSGAALASLCAEGVVLAILLATLRPVGLSASQLLRLAALIAATALAMVLGARLHLAAGIAVGLSLYTVGMLWGRVLAVDDWELVVRLVAAMPAGSRILKLLRQ